MPVTGVTGQQKYLIADWQLGRRCLAWWRCNTTTLFMESSHAYQLILPTDKRNPCFSLYASEDERFIHVFYGLELFEVVPDDHEHMGFKMMVGRLYNAGVKVTTLEDTFNLDRKTIGSWGRAMRSRDPEVLQQVLLGRGASQKRTPAIDRYVVRRRSELLDEGCPEYRATLIREIETIFEVRLSGETIRQIIGGVKGMESPASADFEPPGDPGFVPIIPFLEETTCSPTAISTTGDLPENPPQPSSQDTSGEIPPPPAAPPASKSSPPCWNPLTGDARLCDHLGMLVFADALTTISQAIHQQILANDEAKAVLAKEVSRIDQLIEQKMVRMNLANKTLMDAIKISARNLFYRLFAPFKAAYDNYRDDHDYFRKLTQCNGVLRWTGTELEVHLVPQVNYPPKLRKIITTHLAHLTTSGLTLPDGSGRPLRLRLTRKEQISVSIVDTPEI